MKTKMLIVMASVLMHGTLASNANAQKGMGEPSGVGRQTVKPEVVSLSGKLTEIKTGPCEKTTGRSPIGTHILVETAKGEKLNIHLGPAAAVSDIAARLSPGQEVTAKAFRTDKMPENHYVAQTLAFGKTTVALRDEGLRPFWAGGRGVWPTSAAVRQDEDTAVQRPARGGGARWAGGRRGGGPPCAGGRPAGGPPWAGGGWRGGRGPDAIPWGNQAVPEKRP